MYKILIEKSMNETPEASLEERISPLLAQGYEVVSANTELCPHGTTDIRTPTQFNIGVAHHLYFVTTVVLKKK